MGTDKEPNFNEAEMEYSVKQSKEIPVWQSPKYKISKASAINLINKYSNINESDFWILKNETRTGKMAYTGLIISHNACLKINDSLESKFKPNCMSFFKDGYNNSLVFTYVNDEQGIFEVGEVSKDNCKNAYPYAMALKRCFDRVVLKLSKIAYEGIYSDSEADEFSELKNIKEPSEAEIKDTGKGYQELICTSCGQAIKRNASYTEDEIAELTKGRYGKEVCLKCAQKLEKENAGKAKS